MELKDYLETLSISFKSGSSGFCFEFYSATCKRGKVIEQENASQKIAIIDEKILWYGNINFLGYTENEECCMRIVDNKIASEIEAEVLK